VANGTETEIRLIRYAAGVDVDFVPHECQLHGHYSDGRHLIEKCLSRLIYRDTYIIIIINYKSYSMYMQDKKHNKQSAAIT